MKLAVWLLALFAVIAFVHCHPVRDERNEREVEMYPNQAGGADIFRLVPWRNVRNEALLLESLNMDIEILDAASASLRFRRPLNSAPQNSKALRAKIHLCTHQPQPELWTELSLFRTNSSMVNGPCDTEHFAFQAKFPFSSQLEDAVRTSRNGWCLCFQASTSVLGDLLSVEGIEETACFQAIKSDAPPRYDEESHCTPNRQQRASERELRSFPASSTVLPDKNVGQVVNQEQDVNQVASNVAAGATVEQSNSQTQNANSPAAEAPAPAPAPVHAHARKFMKG